MKPHARQRGLRILAVLLASQLLSACIVLPVPMRPPRVVIDPYPGHDGDSPREHRHRRDRGDRY
ncbi:MAG: hypothetical protein OEY03_11615 [Rhizobacter sp.]|nr:hypothetical protein [Rhizobacter sp.]